jgi:hypothetical protein
MGDKDHNRRLPSKDEWRVDPDFEPISGGDKTTESNKDDTRDQAGKEDRDSTLKQLLNRAITTIDDSGLFRTSYSITEQDRPTSLDLEETKTIATVDSDVIESSDHSISTVEPAANTDSDVANSVDSDIDSKRSFPSSVQQIGLGSYQMQSKDSVSDPIRLQERVPNQIEFINHLRQNALTVDDRAITTLMKPNSATTGDRPRLEDEIRDPGYDWYGGTPYSVTTPQCIVHIDSPEIESLPFLQRVLRDTYAELEGGRPRTETLGIRAGSLNHVSIHGSIVTLDLTTDEWTIDVESNGINIDHEHGDPLSDLRDVVDTLYGGKLGYLVLNISEADLKSRFRSNPETAFVATLLNLSESELEPGFRTNSELFSQGHPPIRIAKPRHTTPNDFRELVRQYFALTTTNNDRVAEIEAAQEARVRRNDWPRIALTERQDIDDGESDEHYLWKATLAGGLAWRMKEQYEQRNDDVSFDEFVDEYLLPSGPIVSEAGDEIESNDTVPDLLVPLSGTNQLWAWLGTRDFLQMTPLDPNKAEDVVFEFETGRGEGAFNLRKLRETVDKYGDEHDKTLCVVIPPRMLFRSESRARMIEQLVEGYSGTDNVALCLPELGRSGCKQVVSAETRLDQWFGDEE